MSPIDSKIWITWEDQRRSRVLADQFGAKLFLLQFSTRKRMIRYFVLIIRTILILIKEKSKYIFCQNPSIILALLLCILKHVFNYKLIVDRHSNFIIDTKNILINKVHDIISDYTIKNADVTIVTNEYLRKLVEKKGGHGVVLQDKLPILDLAEKISLEGKINITFITSFNFDEPIDEVISSFNNIEQSVHLYITGNYKNHPLAKEYLSSKPSNIHFTGFIPEKTYQDLLYSSDVIIVLTKFDHILTCGAYEGISLEKPLILSNTKTIKEYFNKGAVYCDPEAESISEAINNCLQHIDFLKQQVCEYKERNEIEWTSRFNKIVEIVYN